MSFGQPRAAAFAAMSVCASLAAGCTQAAIVPVPIAPLPAKAAEPAPAPVASGKRLTFSGVRLTQGNAVDCPKIQTSGGMIVPVSYLAPSIPIGGRVEVSGFMAVTTSCQGLVLYVEEARTPG